MKWADSSRSDRRKGKRSTLTARLTEDTQHKGEITETKVQIRLVKSFKENRHKHAALKDQLYTWILFKCMF